MRSLFFFFDSREIYIAYYENKRHFTYIEKGERIMLERLVNETLSWCLATVCAVGVLATLVTMNKAYEFLSMVVMF